MALNALKIQTADLVGKLVAQLSNRPTNSTSAGGDNMTAQEVKERYDAYGHLLKERFNALVDALVADPAVDTDALANTIQVYLGDPAEDDPLSLADALVALVTEIAKKYEKPEGGIPATDLAEAVTNAIGEKYVKPGTGIPATDLETAVQTLLGKADTAYQKPSGGIPATDLASAVKAILDSAVSQSEFAPVKALAENADKVLTAANYEAVATLLNAAAKTDYKVGQKILIGAGRVPDLWIYFVHDAAVSYTYTTALAFQTALENGTLQIGYYALRPLEAKTDLEGYATETYVGNAISGNIDATLSTTGKSADAKAVGDAIDALIDALVDGVMAVAEATYAESATYAQQADIANQINTDREIEDADTACPPVVFGTVGGNAEVQNGLMKFPELRGHTIKWNQLCPKNVGSSDNGTASYDSETHLIYVRTTSATKAYGCSNVLSSSDLVLTHKYLTTVKCVEKSDGVNNWWLKIGGLSPDYYTTGQPQSVGTIYRHIFTYASTSPTTNQLNISSGSGSVLLPDGAYAYLLVNVFDLTDIYGAGNEPSTVAEFVRDFPMPYYPYNAGTPISSKSSSVDFIKRNQWDQEWELGVYGDSTGTPLQNNNRIRSKNPIEVLGGMVYYVKYATAGALFNALWYDANDNFIKHQAIDTSGTITAPIGARYLRFYIGSVNNTTYNNDICIYINWDTPGLPYVPYSKQHITLPNLELRSIIGTDIYDVAYQQGGGKRRVGVVDLGTLNWRTTSGSFIAETLSPACATSWGINYLPNVRCAKYTADAVWNDINSAIKDKRVSAYANQVRISDSAYSDAETFKTAMSGVYLYYELATETDITLEENPGWTEYAEIDNFGTVNFNQDPAQTIPVPQAYFVRYTVNLVEFLDSLFVHCGGDVSKLALVE